MLPTMACVYESSMSAWLKFNDNPSCRSTAACSNGQPASSGEVSCQAVLFNLSTDQVKLPALNQFNVVRFRMYLHYA